MLVNTAYSDAFAHAVHQEYLKEAEQARLARQFGKKSSRSVVVNTAWALIGLAGIASVIFLVVFA